MFKSICLVASLALALFALAGASSATAAVHVETCMKGLEECKTTTAGSTFTSTEGTLVVEGMEGEEKDECSVTSKGEVSDPTSEEKGDEMTISITAFEISECSLGALKATGLPWTTEVDAPTYEETEAFMHIPFKFTSWTGCRYEEGNFPDIMLPKVINANPRSFILWSGLMVKDPEQTFCWILRKVHVLETITSISDSQLLGNNLCVK